MCLAKLREGPFTISPGMSDSFTGVAQRKLRNWFLKRYLDYPYVQLMIIGVVLVR